jgi:RNA polymerase sigma factor (sigma-70 family)
MTAIDNDALLTLMRRVQSGESAALANLFDATSCQLNALALRVVRNFADADDVLSDVYRQVWERPQQYQVERGPVIAWLLVITRTRALDLLRKRKHYSTDSDTNGLAHIRAAESAPGSDLVQASQEKSVLREVLLQLTDEQRRMLELAYHFELSHQEIADHTGLALGTVKSHIRRGQQALKVALEGKGLDASAFGLSPSNDLAARSAQGS